MKSFLYPVLSFIIVLLLWQILIWAGELPEALFPSPLNVANAFEYIINDGSLAEGLTASLFRFATGYLAAVVVGIALGLLLGMNNILFRLANPVIQIIRPIAPVAWMPFIVLLIGIGDAPSIVIIFLAGFFPVLLTTASAVHHIDEVYLKVASNYGISRFHSIFQIILPAIFPQIANSIHVALGSSWIFLVSGEMVGTQSGLGYMIIDARNNMRTDILIAAMIVIGFIGFLLDMGIGKLEKRIITLWGK